MLAGVAEWNGAAVCFALGTIALVVVARRFFLAFPVVIVAIVVGIVPARAFGYAGAEIGAIPTGLPPFSLALPWGDLGSLLLPGAVIAFVGFAEPAAVARTFASPTGERWSPNRELLNQGVGGVVSGISGGFPVGGKSR